MAMSRKSPTQPAAPSTGQQRPETLDQKPEMMIQQSLSTSSLKSLTVQIIGKMRPTVSFHVSFTDLKRREEEMKRTAQQFQIPASRWKASRLYQSSRLGNGTNKRVVQFDPEHDIVLQNCTFTLDWKPWLTTLLDEYYQTGQLHVPDECQGSDLLLVLEYFGILYAPGQLVFETQSAYERVRCWSDYLTHRTVLADWVAERVQRVQAFFLDPNAPPGPKPSLQFGTILHPWEKLIFSSGVGEIEPWYDEDDQSVSQLAYRLFNTTDSEPRNLVAENLREDFCVFLQNLLVNEIQAVFALRNVEVRGSGAKATCRVSRAILTIDFVDEPDDDEEEEREPASDPSLHEGSGGEWGTPGRKTRDESQPCQESSGGKQSRHDIEPGQNSPVNVVRDIYTTVAERKKDPELRGNSSEFQSITVKSRASPASLGSESKKDPLTIIPAAPRLKGKSGDESTKNEEVLSAGGIRKTKEVPPHSSLDPNETGTKIAGALGQTRPQQGPVFAPSAGAWSAPFDIIHADKTDGITVASALTGPNFPSDDKSMDTAQIKAEALRHEWVQGSLLNRDIGKHMRILLEQKSGDDNGSEATGPAPRTDDNKYEINEITPKQSSLESEEKPRSIEFGATGRPLSPVQEEGSQKTETDKRNIFPDIKLDPNQWEWFTNMFCRNMPISCAGGNNGAEESDDERDPLDSFLGPSSREQSAKASMVPRNAFAPGSVPQLSGTLSPNEAQKDDDPLLVSRASPSSAPNLVKDRLKKVEKYEWKVENPKRLNELKKLDKQVQQAQKQRGTKQLDGSPSKPTPSKTATTKRPIPMKTVSVRAKSVSSKAQSTTSGLVTQDQMAESSKMVVSSASFKRDRNGRGLFWRRKN